MWEPEIRFLPVELGVRATGVEGPGEIMEVIGAESKHNMDRFLRSNMEQSGDRIVNGNRAQPGTVCWSGASLGLRICGTEDTFQTQEARC